MKRVLLLMLMSECAGILLSHYTNIAIWQLCIMCMAAFYLRDVRGFENNKTGRAVLLCLAMLLCGAMRMDSFEDFESAALAHEGGICSFSGTVLRYKAYTGRIDLILHIDSVSSPGEEPVKADECIIASLDSDDRAAAADLTGRRVRLAGQVSAPAGRRNRGCFDYSAYLASINVFSCVKINKYRLEELGVSRPLLHLLSVYKEAFSQYAGAWLCEEDLGLLKALMFGDKSMLDQDMYEDLRLGGIAHILAVSGLHVGLMYSFVQKLMRGRRTGLTSIVSVCALWLYASLADYSVSVIRAVLMIYIRIASFHLHRRYDSVCGASAVLGGMLLYNPYLIFNSGLQLSFAAAYTMGVAVPWVNLKILQLSDEKKSNAIFYAGQLIGPCVMIQLGMLPLSVFHFLTFSPVSILINPPAAAAASLLLPLGLVLFLIFIIMQAANMLNTASIGRICFEYICGSARILCKAIRFLSDTAADSVLHGRYAAAPALGLLLVYYAAFFFLFGDTGYMLSRRGRSGSKAAVLCLLAASGCIVPKAFGLADTLIPWHHDTRVLSFLDVGQGDSIHLQIDGKNILIDGGGSFYSDIAEDTLRPYLLKNGVRSIDLAAVTHMDADHSRGIARLSEILSVNAMVFPQSCEAEDMSDFKCGDISFVAAGDEIIISENAVLKVLSPQPGRPADGNEAGLVMMLEYGKLKVLLTADAGFDTEEDLIRLYGRQALDCQVLKLAHHGSAYSTGEDFLSAASPDFAVISVGAGNSYGHPSGRVIDLLEESGIIYARTDESGAVCLKSAEDGALLFENAAKDKNWLIKRTTR